MELRLCKIKSLFPIDIKIYPFSFVIINCKRCRPIGTVFIYESIGSLSESNVMKQLSYFDLQFIFDFNLRWALIRANKSITDILSMLERIIKIVCFNVEICV